MIPRHSYLSLYIQEVRQHFEDYVSNFAAKEHIWFEYDDVPLRWFVKFDCFCNFVIFFYLVFFKAHSCWSFI